MSDVEEGPVSEAATPDPAEPDIDTAGVATDDVAPDAAWNRLSARMLLIHPVRETIRLLPALAGLLIAGTSRGAGMLPTLAGLAAVVLYGMTRWLTTRYRVDSERLRVRAGFFSRRELSVARERVRTVDVTAAPMHRLLGLVLLRVGTGSSGRDSALVLDGLPRPAAAELRTRLLDRGLAAAEDDAPVVASERASDDVAPADAAAPGAPPPATTAAERAVHGPIFARPTTPVEEDRIGERELSRLQPRWIRFAPFTSTGLIGLLAILGTLGQLVNEVDLDASDVGALASLGDWVGRSATWLVVASIALAVLILMLLVTLVGYTLAYAGYRLTRSPQGTLHVTRGLLTTRATTLEEGRLRGVVVGEQALLRMAGGARLTALATGLRRGDTPARLLVPPAPREEVLRVGALLLGTDVPLRAPLIGHGPAAARRRLYRALGPAAIPAAASVALGAFGAIGMPLAIVIAFVVLAIALGLARVRIASLGHALDEVFLVSRAGALLRRRHILRVDGTIGLTMRSTLFQRRVGVSTLRATTAAAPGFVQLLDTPQDEAVRVAERLLGPEIAPFLERPDEPTAPSV